MAFRNIFSDIVPSSLTAEFAEFQLWAKARLGGHEKSTVELTDEQLWFALSESDMEFSASIAKAQAKNMMSHFYAQSQNKDILGSVPNFSFSYLNQIALSYGDQAGIGGRERDWMGKIAITAQTQRYYLPNTMTDIDDNAIDWTRGIRIQEVYQNDYVTQMRYMDTWSYYNIMAGEFGVQSALYNTMFAMLPVNANVMMMQHTKFNNKLRLSMYSWEHSGNVLTIWPAPAAAGTLYIRYKYQPHPDIQDSTTAGDGSSSTADNDIIGNFTQIKTNPIAWDNLNSIAKRWIRLYALALCKEILAFNRGKYKSIPFASENNTVELNYEMFDSQAREEKSALREELENDLDILLNHTKILERDANSAEFVNKALAYEPLCMYIR